MWVRALRKSRSRPSSLSMEGVSRHRRVASSRCPRRRRLTAFPGAPVLWGPIMSDPKPHAGPGAPARSLGSARAVRVRDAQHRGYPRHHGRGRLRQPHPGVDRWSGPGRAAGVLLPALHPPDASGHGDDAHLPHHRRRPGGGRDGLHVYAHAPHGLDAARPGADREAWSTIALGRDRHGSGTASWPYEHIYWDQASVLVQLGLLDPATLPVAGRETARKALDPRLPSNALIDRADARGASERRPLMARKPADMTTKYLLSEKEHARPAGTTSRPTSRRRCRRRCTRAPASRSARRIWRRSSRWS